MRRGYRDNPSESREAEYWPRPLAALGVMGGLALLYATWWLVAPYLSNWMGISSTPLSQVTVGDYFGFQSATTIASFTFIGGAALLIVSLSHLLRLK